MNKLTVKDANRLDALRDAFTQAWEALDGAVSAHTDAESAEEKTTLRVVVDAAMAAYVTAHNDLREFCSDLRGTMGDYFEEKSERWQGGASGERYHAWMDRFESVGESSTPELDVSEDGVIDMPEDITSDVDELSSEQD